MNEKDKRLALSKANLEQRQMLILIAKEIKKCEKERAKWDIRYKEQFNRMENYLKRIIKENNNEKH